MFFFFFFQNKKKIKIAQRTNNKTENKKWKRYTENRSRLCRDLSHRLEMKYTNKRNKETFWPLSLNANIYNIRKQINGQQQRQPPRPGPVCLNADGPLSWDNIRSFNLYIRTSNSLGSYLVDGLSDCFLLIIFFFLRRAHYIAGYRSSTSRQVLY